MGRRSAESNARAHYSGGADGFGIFDVEGDEIPGGVTNVVVVDVERDG